MLKWKDNIKMHPVTFGADVSWIHLAQDKIQQQAHVNKVMNLQIP
jgi:hypothetical protein